MELELGWTLFTLLEVFFQLSQLSRLNLPICFSSNEILPDSVAKCINWAVITVQVTGDVSLVGNLRVIALRDLCMHIISHFEK